MMKLYLETSVWNFYEAPDAPEKQEITRLFFDNLPESGYRFYVSRLVIDEILLSDAARREHLLSLIERFGPGLLKQMPAATRLAEEYMRMGALPPAAASDALHVAIATVHEIDAVVSWNLKHIANLRRETAVQAINQLRGHRKPLKLVTPMEVGEL